MFYHLNLKYLLFPIRVVRTSQVASLISTNSLAPETPVVEDYWIFASLTSCLLLLAILCTISASTTNTLSGLYRTHRLTSARILRYLRFLRRVGYPSQRKTRYMVELATPSITGLSPIRLMHFILAHTQSVLLTRT